MAWEQLAPQAITRLSQDLSISPQVAAGIVGQLGYESAGLKSINEINPVVPGSRGGYGWAQWTGPRRRQFESWAKENNMDISDPEANYQFLIYELTQTPEKRVLKDLQGVEDPIKAGQIFTQKFLRPGVVAQDKRDSWTKKAIDFIIPAAQAQGVPMASPSSDWDAISTVQATGGGLDWDSISTVQSPTEKTSQGKEQQTAQVTDGGFDEVSVAQPQDRTITDEGFNTDPTWINNAKKVYSEVEGQPFKGSDADAADWLKNYVAQTNWSLAGAGTTIYDVVNKFSPEGKQALLQSIQDYEKAPTSMESVGRAAKGIATDPTTYAGLGIGSLLTKTFGRKALSKGLQEALKQGLTKTTSSSLGRAATGQTARLAAGAGGFSALDEALRQGVQVSAGGMPGLELGDIALSGAGGAALGVGGSKVIDRLTGRSSLRKFGARAGSENQARIDAEIAQDFQELAKNPNLLTSTTQDGSDVTTRLRNDLAKRYVSEVSNAARIVDPSLAQKVDVKNVLEGKATVTPDKLNSIRGTPEGDLLADSIEKYQRAMALTAPQAASGSLTAKGTRAALQYGPRIATSITGASMGDVPTALLGALVPGVSAGTAQRLTGKKTVPEVIEQLSTGKGLKAAQQAQEILGPSGIPQRAEALTQKARGVQAKQAQDKQAAELLKRAQAAQAAKRKAQREAEAKALEAQKPQLLQATAQQRQGQGLIGRPISGAYNETLTRTGLTNEQAIPLLRQISKDSKNTPLGNAAKELLQSKRVTSPDSLYAVQDTLRDVAVKEGILTPEQAVLSKVTSAIENPIAYAANVRTAEQARDIAVQAAPNNALQQFVTQVAGVKAPDDKAKLLANKLTTTTDPNEIQFLQTFVAPLTKFGKKAK